MNWDAYDKLPPEIQASIDIANEGLHEVTGEPIPERD